MKILFSILFLGFSCLSFSQTTENGTDLLPTAEPWTWRNATKFVKFTPLDVFSVVPTFGIDYEVKMKNENGLQVGLAAIPSFLQPLAGESFNAYDRMGGYRLRFEGRAYMPVKTNQYISAGISFRHLIIRDVVAIGMEEFIGNMGEVNYAYFMDTPMVFSRMSTHFEFKYGAQRIVNDKFVIDFYMGLSLRNINVQTNSKIPSGGGFPDQRGVWTLEDGHKITYPIPIFGFKFGFLAPTWMGGK